MAGPSSRRLEIAPFPYIEQAQQSGFIQREILSGLAPSSLTTSINPIFAPHKFTGNFDLHKLQLTRQLASHLLSTALPVFHSILCGHCGRLQPMGEMGMANTVCFSFPDPLTELTHDQKADTWRMIETFTEPLRYDLETSGAMGWNGCTVPDMIFGTLGSMPGCASKIFMASSSQFYRGLLESLTGQYDLIQHQYCSFKLAVTLVHELTHAAVYAATTDAKDNFKYFLGPQGKTTEMGFEFEAWLFGGVYPEQMFESNCGYYQYAETGRFSKVQSMITANEYPCPLNIANYENGGLPQVVKVECFRSTSLFWNTSFLHIHQMFHNNFWKEIVPSHGRRALFFDRQTGLQCKLESIQLMTPLDQHTVQILEIPDGFDVDRRGLIRRQVAENKDEWSVFCNNLADKLTAELGKMG